MTMILKHLGFSQGTGRVAFQRTIRGSTERLRWTRAGRMYQMIANALRSADTVRRLVPIERSQTKVSSHQLDVTAIALTGANQASVLLVNKASQEVAVRIPWTSGDLRVIHFPLTDNSIDAVSVSDTLDPSGTFRLPAFAFAVASVGHGPFGRTADSGR